QQVWSLVLSIEYTPFNATRSSFIDQYTVYSYLKRLGYIVTRPGIYNDIMNNYYTKEESIHINKESKNTKIATNQQDSIHNNNIFRSLYSTSFLNLYTYKNDFVSILNSFYK